MAPQTLENESPLLLRLLNAKEFSLTKMKANREKIEQERFQSETKLRQECSAKAWEFLIGWSLLVFGSITVLILVFLCSGKNPSLSILFGSPVLVAMIATIPASMVLCGWVIRGLFNIETKDPD